MWCQCDCVICAMLVKHRISEFVTKYLSLMNALAEALLIAMLVWHTHLL